jgi:hypothetical protein
MQPPHKWPRQHQFARKQVHLNFAPLTRAMRDHAPLTVRRTFDRPVDLDLAVPSVAEDRMAQFMGNQKRAFEWRAAIAVQDQPDLGHEHRKRASNCTEPGSTASAAYPSRSTSRRTNSSGDQGSAPSSKAWA